MEMNVEDVLSHGSSKWMRIIEKPFWNNLTKIYIREHNENKLANI